MRMNSVRTTSTDTANVADGARVRIALNFSSLTVVTTLLFGLVALAHAPLAGAQAESAEPKLGVELREIEADLRSKRLDENELKAANKRLSEIEAFARNCVAQQDAKVTEQQDALKGLGEPTPGEPKAVADQRAGFQSALEMARERRVGCQTYVQRAQAAAVVAVRQLQRELEARLFARGPHVVELIRLNLAEPAGWAESWNTLVSRSWTAQAEPTEWALFLPFVVLGVVAGVVLRVRLGRWLRQRTWGGSFTDRFTASVAATSAQDAPYVVSAVVIAATLYVLTRDWEYEPILTAVAEGVCILLFVRLVIRITLRPVPPGQQFLDIPEALAKRLAYRLFVLGVTVLVWYLLSSSVVGAALPERAFALAYSAVRILFVVNVVWALWLFGQLRGPLRRPWFRYGVSLVAIVALVADLAGYTNLSGALFGGVIGTMSAIAALYVLGRISEEVLEGLEYGRRAWQQRLRTLLGLSGHEHIPGFFWLRMVVTLALWAVFIGALIRIWDPSDSVLQEIYVYFNDGFQIGSLRIVPARVVLAIVSLGSLLAFSTWIKRRVEHALGRTPMDRGARETLVTMSGYIIVAIAILVALGVAGLEFSNLAIIAGALSVGIGFGLQNIVNNFVSGLILLFERPVKTGDWIVVGNTEGYVKRISIRSTQIETFDSADVIVPNSELISGQVTNWMLHDVHGRARVPVGVAYGSDTEMVKQLLLEVARAHSDVVTDGRYPEPRVLFLNFGDSSLNFELRCHVKNVDRRLSVISDLNFAIDAAFRANGIEIPFPQRDLHVRDWPTSSTAPSKPEQAD